MLISVGAVAVLAAAAGVLLLADDGGRDGFFAEGTVPAPTVEPVDPARLPDGERVPPDLSGPEGHAGLVILPAGSTPITCPVPAPFGRTLADLDIRGSSNYQQYQGHALYLTPAVPDGWELASARVETAVWDDGSLTDSAFVATYAPVSGGATITVTRAVIELGCEPEVVNRGAGLAHALTKAEVAGHEVLFFHRDPDALAQDPLMSAFWVTGNVYTSVVSSGVELEVIEGFIAAFST